MQIFMKSQAALSSSENRKLPWSLHSPAGSDIIAKAISYVVAAMSAADEKDHYLAAIPGSDPLETADAESLLETAGRNHSDQTLLAHCPVSSHGLDCLFFACAQDTSL
jgi:hypothetical protein